MLSKKFVDFYNTYAYINDTVIIESFWSLDLSEYQSLITTSAKFGVDFFYMAYRELDVDSFVERYLEPSEPEYDHHESGYEYGGISEMSILDCIFK